MKHPHFLPAPNSPKQHLIFVLSLLLLFWVTDHPAHAAPTATFTVDRTDDNAAAMACTAAANDCSLRGAIRAANAAAGADTIVLPAGTYTLSITGTGENAAATGDLDITGNLTITGAGASTTTINANSVDRVFHGLPAAATTLSVSISGVTIRGGSLPGGITNMGAAFASDATSTGNTALTLASVTITANSTGNNGGGVGFIKNAAAANHSLTMNNSTISGNTALNGGGINCAGCALTITNSTISGNGASTSGGGINVTVDTSTVTLTNVTIASNTANGDGGGIAKILGTGTISLVHTTVAGNTADNDANGAGDGGGIRAISNATLRNSIVQGNTDSTTPATSDCSGMVTSNNFNVVGSGTGCPSGGANDSTAAALLGPLANNSGPTLTRLPGAGSSAINRIPNGSSNCVGGTSLDQRGIVRAGGGGTNGGSGCDSGAVEGDSNVGPTAITLVNLAVSNPANTLLFVLAGFGLIVAVYLLGRGRVARQA